MMLTISPRTAMVVGLFALCRGVELSIGPQVLNISCPFSCEDLFGRLDEGVQKVEVQLRGGEAQVFLWLLQEQHSWLDSKCATIEAG